CRRLLYTLPFLHFRALYFLCFFFEATGVTRRSVESPRTPTLAASTLLGRVPAAATASASTMLSALNGRSPSIGPSSTAIRVAVIGELLMPPHHVAWPNRNPTFGRWHRQHHGGEQGKDGYQERN